MAKLKKIISGGQTGVDQAALQAAIDSGLKHGGWCPPGKLCETGLIPSHYTLFETPFERDISTPDVPRSQRTIWNVRDSDAPLILTTKNAFNSSVDHGTRLAIKSAQSLERPLLAIDVLGQYSVRNIRNWLNEYSIQILNIAGPSATSNTEIYKLTYSFLVELFR